MDDAAPSTAIPAAGKTPDPGRWSFVLRPWFIPTVLALLPFLLFWPITFLLKTFYVHDVQHFFYPYHVVSANLLRSGSLPLWDPYVFSGMPLIGDGQSAMFYPPNWLFFLLPGIVALNYALLLQFSIAGVGMYYCAKHFRLGTSPALVAALSFMFSGCITGRVVHLSFMSAAALMPLAVLSVDSALVRGTRRGFATGALCLGLQALTGHPQIPVYTAVALGLLAGVRAAELAAGTRTWRAGINVPLRLAGMYVLGYGLAAVQIIPWVELGLYSCRATRASFDFIMGHYAHGTDWLLFLFPFISGSQEPGFFTATPVSFETAARGWEHTVYVGILPLALAFPGLACFAWQTWHKKRDGRWHTLLWLSLVLLVSVIMGAGQDTPAAKLIYALPVLGKLRDVERALALASFVLPLLAGFGLQWLGERVPAPEPKSEGRGASPAAEKPSPQPGAGGPPLAEILIPCALLTVAVPLFWTWFAHQSGELRPLAGVSPADLSYLVENPNCWLMPLGWAIASAALMFRWSFRSPGVFSRTLALGLVAADMGVYARCYNQTTEPRQMTERPASLEALQGEGGHFRKATVLSGSNELPLRAARETLAVSWGMPFGIEDINGFNSLQPRRYTDYIFGPQVEDVSYGFLSNEALLQQDSPILPSLNVRYILVPAWLQPRLGPHLREVWRNESVGVYENRNVWPRAFFAQRVRIENDPPAVLRTVTAPGFDARLETLVESTTIPALAPGAPGAVARLGRHEPNRLELTTQTEAARLLVLSEMYFPGWRAYVDGSEVPMHRANYLFRSLVVPAGAHTVLVVYRPQSVSLGALISGISLLIGAWLSGLRWWKRKGPLAGPPSAFSS